MENERKLLCPGDIGNNAACDARRCEFDIMNEQIFYTPDRPVDIVFIGDSITCGAGNKVKDGESLSGHYEDGYNAYGTVTARLLDADWSNISVSGSSLIDDRDREPTRYHMPTEYSHAIKGKSSTQSDYEWNFETNRNADIVVINLGTNDNGFISIYSGIDTNKKVAYFKDLAVAFAKQIIKANGEDVKIIFD